MSFYTTYTSIHSQHLSWSLMNAFHCSSYNFSFLLYSTLHIQNTNILLLLYTHSWFIIQGLSSIECIHIASNDIYPMHIIISLFICILVMFLMGIQKREYFPHSTSSQCLFCIFMDIHLFYLSQSSSISLNFIFCLFCYFWSYLAQ
jgi:hypothetical protein